MAARTHTLIAVDACVVQSHMAGALGPASARVQSVLAAAHHTLDATPVDRARRRRLLLVRVVLAALCAWCALKPVRHRSSSRCTCRGMGRDRLRCLQGCEAARPQGCDAPRRTRARRLLDCVLPVGGQLHGRWVLWDRPRLDVEACYFCLVDVDDLEDVEM